MIEALLPLLLHTLQQPPHGIDRELARERAARVSSVRYELAFDLVAGSDEVAGRATIRFALRDTGAGGARGARGADGAGSAGGSAPPLVLDFGGRALRDFTVNGRTVAAERGRVHDHLVIDGDALAAGENTISASFTAAVAPTGSPLTMFREGGQEFVYTLLVPADAHRLFPCFDQPDLKATFRLTLTTPGDWVAVGNAAEERPAQSIDDGDGGAGGDTGGGGSGSGSGGSGAGGRRRWTFAETKPLSTYLFAFAAGPFDVLEPEKVVAGTEGAGGGDRARPPLRLFVRRPKVEEARPAELFALHARALRFLDDDFDFPYPFGKLDLVLLPGFPYGGMEHAGAIFYRESTLAFDHPPTASELTRRSALVYHELSHQWFGNLVTMEWFDDVWLKEGFATFCGYRLLAALEPERDAWLRFHQDVAPAAYRVDMTPGTTPVWQELLNLDDAKSAYGAIVYNKAPAVLRELHERLGEDAFRRGMRAFLREHAFGTARWQDLVAALERASGARLGAWSERWVTAAGMPRVRADFAADEHGRLTRFAIRQESVQGDGGTWPLRVEVLLLDADRGGGGEGGGERVLAVETAAPSVEIEELVGTPAPACVLLNPHDVAYGQFLPDAASREHMLRRAGSEPDPLRRAVMLAALRASVLEAELSPLPWTELLLARLRDEHDPQTHAWLLAELGTALQRWLHEDDRKRLTCTAVELLRERLTRGMPGLELQTFRFLLRHATETATLDLCEGMVAGTASVPGLRLGVEDRYRALAALIAGGRGGEWVAAMTGERTPTGAEKYAFVALAAAPDAATKARYFATYLQPDEPPEQWMQESLASFHWPGQEELALPDLRPALDRLLWVKEHRKIFFLPAWIDAFVNAHSDRAALALVDAFLGDAKGLPLDVRRKVLQSLDGLRRAVRIRETWK